MLRARLAIVRLKFYVAVIASLLLGGLIFGFIVGFIPALKEGVLGFLVGSFIFAAILGWVIRRFRAGPE